MHLVFWSFILTWIFLPEKLTGLVAYRRIAAEFLFFLMGASYPWVVCIPDKCANCSCSFPYFTYLTIWNYLNTCISTQKWSWIQWIIKIKKGSVFPFFMLQYTVLNSAHSPKKKKQYKTSLTDEINCLQPFFHKMIITWEQRQYSLARLPSLIFILSECSVWF